MVTGIFPPDIGGPATYVPQVTRALFERGHDVRVLTLSDRPDYDDGGFPFGVERVQRQGLKPVRWARTVARLIRVGHGADLLFANGLHMEAIVASKILRRPIVLKVVGDVAWERATSRGWVNEGFEEFQSRRYGLVIELLKGSRSWWTRQARKVIVPSQYLGRWVASWGVPWERIAVVYNAVDAPSDLKPVDIRLDASCKAVTVGRLVPWKHVDRVIRVIAKSNGIGLVVVGDGPERDRLEALVRQLGVSERVYLAGQRSKSETLSLMAACDLLVLNSTYEGLPHVLLEAMSLGLPVVATSVGGTPELVRDGENGCLVPPLDDEALLRTLSNLSSDSRARISLAACARESLVRFGFEEMIEKTAALLEAAVCMVRQRGLPMEARSA